MRAEESLHQLQEIKIVGIFRKYSKKQALTAAEMLMQAGIRSLEITMDGDEALDIIATLRQQYGDKILLAAGTVRDAKSLEEAVRAGVDLLFSPHLDEGLVELANDLHQLLIPGIMTPTELARAMKAGARAVKLFPAGTLGTSYVKNLRGPFSDIPIVVTGGVSLASAESFIRAGACAVGVGSSLFADTQMGEEGADSLRESVKTFLEAVRRK